MSVFNSETVITEHISNAKLRAFFVGFDFQQFRYDPLVDKLMSAIVDFAFGYHDGILNTYKIDQLREAARLVYKIEDYDPSNPDHLKTITKKDKDGKKVKKKVPYKDEEDFRARKYYNRGEFGELILHVLLRDFLNTDPLLSKMYFKDSTGNTVHGLDAVHIGDDIDDSTQRSIFLGESKLHRTGETGVAELLDDVKKHFNSRFLNGEFLLIGKKRRSFLPVDEYVDKNTVDQYQEYLKQKNYWYDKLIKVQKGEEKLQALFASVTIPMICTYTSELFEKHDDETTIEFQNDFKAEIEQLEDQFKKGLIKIKKEAEKGEPIATDLNIVLMLFPVPDKKELVKRMHTKLHHQQRC